MLIDTHAHINLHAFIDDADEVIRRSLAAGVQVINVGTELQTSKQAVAMLDTYSDGVYAVIGLHPSHTYDNPYLDENESAFVTQKETFDYALYKELAQHEKVVGIGECGLDYYRLDNPNQQIKSESIPMQVIRDSGRSAGADGYESGKSTKLQQKEAFEKQIQLAMELDKALVIHCRPSKGTIDAYEDMTEILSAFIHSKQVHSVRHSEPASGEESILENEILQSQSLLQNDKSLRFEIHSYTGPVEVAQKFIDLGGYIGLNGIITFDKTGNLEQVVKGVPLESIVLETDSPYLAPLPYRGKRNEPVYVQEVAKKIAEWKGVDVQEVAMATTANARILFKLEL